MRSSDGAISGARAGARRHRDHAGAERHPRDAAPHDRRRLRRAPGDARTISSDGEARGDRAGRAASASATPDSGADQQRGAEPSAATTPKVVGRRCVLMRTQRLAAAVLLDQRADVEPRPAADEHADVAIVGPAFVDLDRCGPRASCRSQSVSCVSTRSADVHVSLQKRSSVTLPEISSSARHASAERRPRSAARLRLRRRQRHFRRRQHAADAAAHARERLDEVQIGDRRAVPRACCRGSESTSDRIA